MLIIHYNIYKQLFIFVEILSKYWWINVQLFLQSFEYCYSITGSLYKLHSLCHCVYFKAIAESFLDDRVRNAGHGRYVNYIWYTCQCFRGFWLAISNVCFSRRLVITNFVPEGSYLYSPPNTSLGTRLR